jgi:hypothetical protein
MFRRTLVAIGLATLAGQGMAATLAATGGAVEKSPEAIATSVNVAGAASKLTAKALVPSGATLNMTYTSAPTNPSLIDAVVDAGSTCAAGDKATYAGATNDGKTLNYSVITANGAAIPVNCIIDFGTTTKPTFAKASVTATGVSVTSAFTSVGAGLDPSAAKAVLLKLGTAQFTLTTTTAANAVIDVENAKKKFTVGTADDIVLTTGNTAKGATVGTSKIVLTGDFSWADNPATAGFQILGSAISVTGSAGAAVNLGTAANAPTASTITITDDSPADGDTYTITFTPPTGAAAVVLPVGTFSATQTTQYTDEASSAGSAVATKAAGGFTLNGAVVKVFSVPFGPEVESHSIFVSNSGTTTGAITGSLSWAGNDAVEFSLGNIEPKANLYLPVASTLTALGELPPFGRGDITFTVNSPAADITITAAYNTAEGRANLFMQEQANIASISNAAKTSSAAAATSSAAAATDAGTAATQSTAANTAAGCVKTAMGEGVDAGVGSVVVGTAQGIITGVASGFMKYTSAGAGC